MKTLNVLSINVDCNYTANSNISLYEPKVSIDIEGLYTDTKEEILLSS